MARHHLRLFVLVIGFFAAQVVCDCSLYAQAKKTGLSPDDEKKLDELIRSAKTNEMIGYVAAGAAILLVVAGITLSVYLDRRKKAHQKTLQAKATKANQGAPPNERRDQHPS